MKRSLSAGLLALVAALWAIDARAQETPYELNLHVGVLNLDVDDDSHALLGARFMLQYPSGWGWGGNFDWVNVDDDVNLYLYSFEIDHTFPSTGPLDFFVGGGLGAATVNIDDDGDDESETEILLPLAGGIKYGNRPTRPTWAIRAEIRDNIIFGDFGTGDDDASNNFEFSGGVSFFF